MPNKLPEKLDLPPVQGAGNKIPDAYPGNLPFIEHLNMIETRQRTIADIELNGLRKQRIEQIQKLRDSRLIVYYSVDILDHKDAEELYDVLSCYPQNKKIDLFLLSPGGYSGAAFKIARMFQEHTSDGGKFSVLIPYYAKSAATILSLGADEIVMGQASELGPIDPQLPIQNGTIPLLALKDAIDYIKTEVIANPATAQLFWPIIQQIKLMSLGQFEREICSAKQYAEKLLGARMFSNRDPREAINTAEELTSAYKNHGYIIDRTEARNNLHLNVVDASKELWDLIWQLHKIYDLQIRRSQGKVAKFIETLEHLKTRTVTKIGNTINSEGDINAPR